ncbi:MAG: mycothiol synthase [Mycobacterium sp.]|nr:mycothiol synthase [Mycobacterium sp.]
MTALAWRAALSDADQRQIRDVIAAATAHDGVAPVGDQVLRELSHDRTRHLVAEDGGTVVGYLNLVAATADSTAMAELVVHPTARRRRIGAALIRTGLTEGGAGARVWAHGDLEPARATAAALGLASARQLLQMRRSLADLPADPIPDGVRVATYPGHDADEELLRVNNAAFAWHPEQGGWTEADVAERRAEPWFDPAGLFLATDEESGKMLGFHWTKVHVPATSGGQERSDSGRGLGEVYVVAVDPTTQGRGIGALLTLVGLRHLAERLGAESTVMLYVEANNSAAVRTYRKLGFEVFGTDVAYTLR